MKNELKQPQNQPQSTSSSQRGRPLKRENLPASQITAASVTYVTEYYLKATEKVPPSLRTIANELGISNTKLKKLLITGGIYNFGKPESEEIIRKIVDYRRQGKTVPEICALVGLKRSTVESYLPYEKIVYTGRGVEWMSKENRSLNAERCEKYRQRKRNQGEIIGKN